MTFVCVRSSISLSESIEGLTILCRVRCKTRFGHRLLIGLDCLSCLELGGVDEALGSGELYSALLLCNASRTDFGLVFPRPTDEV